MTDIEYAAYQHAGLKGPRSDYDTTYYQAHECKVYDAFVTGAMARKLKNTTVKSSQQWLIRNKAIP